MAEPSPTIDKEKEGRLKLRRAGKPKTRSGCFACKQKRLKCDESHPCCLRCWRSSTVCIYPPPRPSFKASSEAQRPTPLKAALTRPGAPGLPIYASISGILSNESEVENNYVRYFHQAATSGFESVMDWSIWSGLILQFSHQEPFVRDCVIAIGSLLRSFSASSTAYTLTLTSTQLSVPEKATQSTTMSLAQMHRHFALLKYSRAVKTMRTVLPTAEPRSVMLACLLVCSLEMMLKNGYSTLEHLISGQRLFRQWLSTSQSGPRTQVLLSPDPTQVEDSLVEAFEHLDLQLSTIWDPRPLEVHRAIILEGADSIQNMPEMFGSVREARHYLHLVIRRTHHFLGTSWSASKVVDLSISPDLPPLNSLTVNTGSNVFSTSYSVPDSLHEEQAQYIEDISRWKSAFAPLFRQTRCPVGVSLNELDTPTRRSLVLATLLQLHALCASIALAGVLFRRETAYDVFLPQFTEMVSLATVVCEVYHSRQRETRFAAPEIIFSIDLGITAPLFLLLLRCRDGELRRRALRLMRAWHAENCWRPVLVAEYGAFVMDVEEKAAVFSTGSTAESEGGKGRIPLMRDIPEESRAVITRISEDSASNQTVAQGKPAGSATSESESLVQVVQRYWKGGAKWSERSIRHGLVGGGEIILERKDIMKSSEP